MMTLKKLNTKTKGGRLTLCRPLSFFIPTPRENPAYTRCRHSNYLNKIIIIIYLNKIIYSNRIIIANYINEIIIIIYLNRIIYSNRIIIANYINEIIIIIYLNKIITAII